MAAVCHRVRQGRAPHVGIQELKGCLPSPAAIGAPYLWTGPVTA